MVNKYHVHRNFFAMRYFTMNYLNILLAFFFVCISATSKLFKSQFQFISIHKFTKDHMRGRLLFAFSIDILEGCFKEVI